MTPQDIEAAEFNLLYLQSKQNTADTATNSADILENVATTATKLVKVPTPTGASRSLDTVFQIDPDYPALVFYTIELGVTAPLLSPEFARVQLLHDQSNPPTTQDGEAYIKSEQLAGLSLVNLETNPRQVIPAWIPAGDYVKLVSSGTGASALVGVVELVFNG